MFCIFTFLFARNQKDKKTNGRNIAKSMELNNIFYFTRVVYSLESYQINSKELTMASENVVSGIVKRCLAVNAPFFKDL